MSALLEFLMAIPWRVHTIGHHCAIVAIADDGQRAGVVAADVPRQFAEHIVECHNKELSSRTGVFYDR